MAGFKAQEAVELLDYDFSPYADAKGTINEPSSDEIETYRSAIFDSIKGLGVEAGDLADESKLTFDQVSGIMEKSSELEASFIEATAALTKIDAAVLAALPYRIKQAFLGWIMGVFFNPEA